MQKLLESKTQILCFLELPSEKKWMHWPWGSGSTRNDDQAGYTIILMKLAIVCLLDYFQLFNI